MTTAKNDVYRHGDPLPDTDTSYDRTFIEYAAKETDEDRAKRIKQGLPAPTISFVAARDKRTRGAKR